MRTAGRRKMALIVALGLLAGCATTSPLNAAGSAGTQLHVVAVENFWGSIASQLGGDKVAVTSLIASPDIDPHDYEPSAGDVRLLDGSQVAIVNGIGYDPWATKVLGASHRGGARQTVDVGIVVGATAGSNPHRWYNPDDVEKVITAITAAYSKVDPANAAYFVARQHDVETTGLASYHAVIARIKAGYAGTPVGASESIFAMMAPALGLNLVTPATFLRAVSEGTDPTASDKQTINQQIATHAIKIYVYNSQNATPDVQAQITAARAARIPVTTITETLTPATATFQQWQLGELTALQNALARGTS